MFTESLSGASTELRSCRKIEDRAQGDSEGCEVNDANVRTYGLMANTAAIALAAIEQCQEPILELHEFVEDPLHAPAPRPEDLSFETFYDEDGEIDFRYEYVIETPQIFDDEGNFDEVAFDRLEEGNHMGNDIEEWYATDGLYWADMKRIGRSLPQRRAFAKKQIPQIVMLATAFDRLRRLTPRVKRVMDYGDVTSPLEQTLKCPRQAD